MAHRTMTDELRARVAPTFAALSVALVTGCYGAGMKPLPYDATAQDDARDAAPEAAVDATADVRFVLEPRNVDAPLLERSPASFAVVELPMAVRPALPWVTAGGRGYVVSAEGRFFTIDAYGAATELERLAGDVPGMRESPANAVTELSAGEPTALVPDGAIVVRDGTFRRASLPPLLANARAVTRWSGESLWATGAGLYTTLGARWMRLDRAGEPVTDAVSMVEGPSSGAMREAWVLRANGSLYRLRVTGRDAAVDVVWSDPVVGLELDDVRAIAALGGARYIARATDLLRVTATGAVERVRIPGATQGPSTLVTASRWLWMVWPGGSESAVARYDGERVEVLARGLFSMSTRVAVDGARGDVALLVDGTRARRLVAEAAPMVTGFAEGAVVTEPRLALQIDPPTPAAVSEVSFSLDGTRIERVLTPPFRWGDSGAALYRSFPMLEFGTHTVEAVVSYTDAPELRVSRTFHYLSPLGRVPTYQGDILALYNSACARCHSTNIARDLRGYQRLADMAPVIADVVVSRRMPPDLTLDTPSIQIFSAWVAGGSPER